LGEAVHRNDSSSADQGHLTLAGADSAFGAF
jgi:hypothetical protein